MAKAGTTQLKHPRSARAFTLAEALIAATTLAVVGATAMLPFVAGTQQILAAAELEQAVALGEGLMEEILARPFFEPGDRTAAPGPESGETGRTLFDNIDDFHGFAESAGALKTFSNTAVADTSAEGFWRTSTVEYVTFPIQQAGDVNSFVRITVQVFKDGVPLVTLTRIAARED